jgi:hypothetical protein
MVHHEVASGLHEGMIEHLNMDRFFVASLLRMTNGSVQMSARQTNTRRLAESN